MNRLAAKVLLNGVMLLARLEARLLPVAWLYAMGRVSARLMVRWLPGLRASLLDNARHLLGPESSEAARRQLAVDVLTSFSRLFVVLLTAPREFPPVERLIGDMQGREHGERAVQLGRGVIAITLHMGNYELGSLVFHRRFRPAALVYREDPVGLVEKIRARTRRLADVEEIKTDSPLFGVRALDVLRQRGSVMVAGDIGFAADRIGEPFPFLDGVARFHTWPARLSLRSGAPLLPSFVVWDGAAGAYRLVLEPPILPEEHGDVAAVMRQLIAVYERYVRRYPEQWLILHRYWEASRSA